MIKKSVGKRFERALEFLHEVALFLFIFMTVTLILAQLLFICGAPIASFYLPAFMIISVVIYAILRKKRWPKLLWVVMAGILIFGGLTFIIGKTYDTTIDGNTYHELMVGAMKNGWNPVWESVGNFNKDQGNSFDIYEDNINVRWADSYAKATETFGAVVYAFTNNIEAGKVFNILLVFIELFLFYGILRQMKLSAGKSVLLATIMAINPITLVQITNYYLDGALTVCLFLVILLCLLPYNKKTCVENYLILAMAIIWCIGIKFNGLAYCGVFCLVFYLYRHIKNYVTKNKMFGKLLIRGTLFYLVVVLISVGIVGSSSYVGNFLEHGNPFYPLYGSDISESQNRMVELPESMQDKNSFELFVISVFSKSENVSPSYSIEQNDPNLKIPLTTTAEEINNFNIPDIRIGGFGPMFSAIFLLSIVGTVYVIIDMVRKRDFERLILYGLIIATTFVLALCLEGNFWARYVPYIFLLPIYVLIYIWQQKSGIFLNTMSWVCVILFVVNILCVAYPQIKRTIEDREFINKQREIFMYYVWDKEDKGEDVVLKVDMHGMQGALYHMDDWGVDNYVLTDDTNEGRNILRFTY